MGEKDKRLVPELRFPGFEEEWKLSELGDLFLSIRKKGSEGYPIYSVSQKEGLIPRDAIERNIQNDADPKDSLLVKPKDIVYNMMRMWQGAYGIANKACIVSPAYIVLRPKEGQCSVFFNFYFMRKRSLYLFMAYSYGFTLDRLRLYYKDFSQIAFLIPLIPEQRKIASFLSVVDKRLSLLQKKK